ncbi:bacterial extracellular solute-binding s, 3 family protein, partial [Escherichia coli 89.0511]
LLRHYPFY